MRAYPGQSRARLAKRGTSFNGVSNVWAGPRRQRVRRAAVVLACVGAWCILSAVPLPGLAPTAVAGQLSCCPLSVISVTGVGVLPVIYAMLILFLLGVFSVRLRQALGTTRDLRYQATLTTLVLVSAVFVAEGWLTQLRTEGLLGSAPTDYYVAWVTLVAGSAVTLGLGWLVARYGLRVTPVRGWLFFVAADFLSYWAYWAKTDWDQINPRSLSDIWPVAANAAIVVASLALLAVLLRVRRRIPLHLPSGAGLAPYRMPDEAVSLPLLMGGGLFPAVMADAGVNAVNSAIQLVHGPPLADPAVAGVLFLLGLGSVAVLQRASFSPDVVASTLRKGFAQIPGIRPGEATAAYIRRRVTLLTVIAAPWFAVLLAAPHLVRLLLPPEARYGLNGVTIVLVGTIVIGILDRRGESGSELETGLIG